MGHSPTRSQEGRLVLEGAFSAVELATCNDRGLVWGGSGFGMDSVEGDWFVGGGVTAE